MDPGLNTPEVRNQPEQGQTRQNFGDMLKSLFGKKK